MIFKRGQQTVPGAVFPPPATERPAPPPVASGRHGGVCPHCDHIRRGGLVGVNVTEHAKWHYAGFDAPWPSEWVDALSDELRTFKQTSGLQRGCVLSVADVFTIIDRSLTALARIDALRRDTPSP
jgi:hypothetical protein